MRLDIHNHAVPETVLAFYRREQAFGVRVTGDHRLSGGPEGEYELRPEFFDADVKVKELEDHGLEGAIISVDPPFFHYEVEPTAGEGIAEVVNEGLRAMCAKRPDRLRWMATVPMQTPERAATMLERQRDLGCVGVEIGTSTGRKRLDEPEFEPFWACAEELAMPVMLHPAYQHPHPGYEGLPLINPIGNLLETTVAIERLIMLGVLDRHPNLRVVIVHSGGYVAYQQGRLRHARAVRVFPEGSPECPSDYFGQVKFDCLTHDRKALAFLIDQVGVDNVLMGTDLPCDMAAPDPWNELVAVAGDSTARQISEANVTTLYGLS